MANQPDARGFPAGEVEELRYVIASLREHCPWMGALTHASLVEYLLEEAFEVAETIEAAAPSTVESASSTANSSPPKRAGRSMLRAQLRSSRPTRASTRSPMRCP